MQPHANAARTAEDVPIRDDLPVAMSWLTTSLDFTVLGIAANQVAVEFSPCFCGQMAMIPVQAPQGDAATAVQIPRAG